MEIIYDTDDNMVIGDAILHNPGYTYDMIHLDKNIKYKGTFLWKYSEKLKNKPRNDSSRLKNFNIAKDIVLELNNNKKNVIPLQDEIVVHVRLGDIFLSEKNKQQYFLKNRREIINSILNFKFKKVTIVTAFHTAKLKKRSIQMGKEENFLSKKCKEESIKHLNNFLEELKSNNLIVKIRSSKNHDDDFLYLCNAKNLILTGVSGFSKVADILNKMIKKNKYN